MNVLKWKGHYHPAGSPALAGSLCLHPHQDFLPPTDRLPLVLLAPTPYHLHESYWHSMESAEALKQRGNEAFRAGDPKK